MLMLLYMAKAANDGAVLAGLSVDLVDIALTTLRCTLG
jgi:hypothetical protein